MDWCECSGLVVGSDGGRVGLLYGASFVVLYLMYSWNYCEVKAIRSR